MQPASTFPSAPAANFRGTFVSGPHRGAAERQRRTEPWWERLISALGTCLLAIVALASALFSWIAAPVLLLVGLMAAGLVLLLGVAAFALLIQVFGWFLGALGLG